MEITSITELAQDLKMKKAQLIRLFQREGFIKKGYVPTESMLDSGYMLHADLDNNSSNTLPLLTSDGYFYFLNHLSKYPNNHLKKNNIKPTRIQKRGKRDRLIIKKKKQW
jgi:hypothetical protein